MNTLHLFLNSAKSSQAGNRKEEEANVCCNRAVFSPVAPPLIPRPSGHLLFRVHHHSKLTLPCLLSAIHYCGSHAPWHSANVHFNVTSIRTDCVPGKPFVEWESDWIYSWLIHLDGILCCNMDHEDYKFKSEIPKNWNPCTDSQITLLHVTMTLLPRQNLQWRRIASL